MVDREKQRKTKQKQEVFDSVMSRYDHPDADAIYTQIRSLDPHISKGTVYRNLNMLAEQGEILRISMSGQGGDRFDLTTKPHYHLVCTKCGKVIDAPVQYHAEDDMLAGSDTGFKILGHNTVFKGICPECQKKV